MEDLYLKILERLSKKGISQETEISDLFDGYFLNTIPKQIEQTDEGPAEQSDIEHIINLGSNPKSEDICKFLNTMVINEHLTYINKTVQSGDFNRKTAPISFFAKITKDGLDYYYNRQLQITTIENYKIQRLGLIITTSLAFIAALFSVLNFFKAEPKMVELNKNIQVLSKETEGIKQQIIHLQNQKTLLADSSRKH